MGPMTRPRQTDVQFSIRLPSNLAEQAESIADALRSHPVMGAANPTRSTVIRLALLRGLDALAAEFPPSMPVPAEPKPKGHAAEPKAPKKSKADRVRAELERAIEGGARAKDLAAAAGVDPGQLSRFRKGDTIGEAKLDALLSATRR